MKILIDDEIFIIQRYGGVSRIFSEIIKRLSNDKNNQLFFNNLYTENEYLLNLKRNILKPYLLNFNFPLKGKILRTINRFFIRYDTLKKISSVDIFHPSFYSDYYFKRLKKNKKTKLVFTVHDLIHELMPLEKGNKKLALIKQTNIKIASKIIVVSESTKRDLLKIYPFVDENKITVVYLASSLNFDSQAINNLPNKYILFVGERNGYKNFQKFVFAFAKFAQEFTDFKLVCTGSKPFSKEEKKIFTELNIQYKVYHFKCKEAELKYIYENAFMFVFPSLYEGFGIPILEAFQCGTPAILSDSSSLPEIAGDAAIYFNPNSEDDIYRKILSLVENPKLRKELIDKGKTRLLNFSWDKHYKATLNVYRKALNENTPA